MPNNSNNNTGMPQEIIDLVESLTGRGVNVQVVDLVGAKGASDPFSELFADTYVEALAEHCTTACDVIRRELMSTVDSDRIESMLARAGLRAPREDGEQIEVPPTGYDQRLTDILEEARDALAEASDIGERASAAVRATRDAALARGLIAPDTAADL